LRGRFDAATGLVAVGATLLLVSLFVRWFRPGGDAWAIFELVDVVLAGAALAGLAHALADPLRFPALARWMPLLAGATLVIVAVQAIDPPPAARGAERATGLWLAFAGSLLMAGGAALSAADIAVTVDVRERVRRAAIDARRGAAGRAGAGAAVETPPEAERTEIVDEPPPPPTDAGDPGEAR
jgi:hypothetical protein